MPRFSHTERAVLAVLYRTAEPLKAAEVAGRAAALGVSPRRAHGALRRLLSGERGTILHERDGLYTVAAAWRQKHAYPLNAPRHEGQARGAAFPNLKLSP